ncbi:yajA domain protein [Candidatus Erwinia dacicola]|uniref:YajA domain protein n=1 Tax=Candidatus Erwinia dacicola TaxID=252393 RepID=A0A2T6MUQ6_9GAMM|nr:yajA domain protein [Candidatus Erwinia dacicola]RAP69936.1 yajA domain protein [Candidatus Erwinia dacicola]RAP70333.1 yajA domain protein [Candidatus Erwinia dacicola]
MKINNTPENVKAIRKKLSLTQTQCAKLFGVSLRSWQRREAEGTIKDIKTSKIEFEYLLLLAGEHPDYLINKRSGSSNYPMVKTIKLPDERFIYHDSDYDDGYVRGWNAYRLESIQAIHTAGAKVEGVEEDDLM